MSIKLVYWTLVPMCVCACVRVTDTWLCLVGRHNYTHFSYNEDLDIMYTL